MRWTLLARHTSLAALATAALLVQGFPASAATPGTTPTPLPAPAAAPASPGVAAAAPVGEITALGSPTRTVTKNADGTTTVKITPTKSRYKDPAGVWRDLDLTLVPKPDGSLGAKAADNSVPRIAKATTGKAGLVSAPTVAGPIVLAHLDTTPGLAPRLAGAKATFGKATAGRDVQVQLRPDGFEESLLLASAAALAVPGGAAAAGSDTETFTLPAGVTARQAKTGVEFLDRTGAVIASYGGGSAQDSKIDPRSGDPASSPVTTTLVGQPGVVATVHVAADPAWLADPARVFPITVDPTFAADTSSEGPSFDTYTYSPNPTTAEGSYDPNILKVGSFDGGASRARTYLMFNLNGFQNTNVPVQSAQLSLFNNYSYGCASGGQSIFAQAAGGPFSRGGTTWNNQPGGDGASPNIGSGPFAHGHDSSCGPDWVRWDIGAQAQRWSNGAVNNGLRITSSDETNSFGWRKFANGTSGGTAPSLVITYGTNNCTYYPQTGHSVCGAIRDHYNALGGPNGFLGYPTSDETTNPDGVGKRNTFQNGGDSIYWSPATGAAEIGGAIMAHWGNYGYETGPLGYPTSDEIGTPNGAGRYNVFQNVNDHIYWTPATGAQEIGGSIFTHWGDFGFEAGRLGFPTTDETGTPDGFGRFNHFQGAGGSIYFTPATGTHEIEGAIYTHWGQLGYETGVLGYPVTDETGTPDGTGRFNHFFKNSTYAPGVTATANGSIYYTVSTGAHEVHNPIRAKWAALGYETSCLAYPTSDVQTTPTGQQSTFQGGTVTYTSASGQTTSSCGNPPPPAVPGAPTNVIATGGDGSASVAFTPPPSDGGSAITGYTVTSGPGGKTASGPTSPITVTGLTNGTSYTFTVIATNANGNSAPSAPSNAVTPAGPPPPPPAGRCLNQNHCWGVDAGAAQTQSNLDAIKNVYGYAPDFFGRYLTIPSGAGSPINQAEVGLLANNNISVMLLTSGFGQSSTEGSGSGPAGTDAANAAADAAGNVGIQPNPNIAIYADIESSTNVTPDFITAFSNQLQVRGFRAGFYGSEAGAGSFATSFCTASANNPNVSNAAIFASSPDADGTHSTGRTTAPTSPVFAPDPTHCAGGAPISWQYGISGTDNVAGNTPPAIVNGPDVDTDEYAPNALNSLYLPPKPPAAPAAARPAAVSTSVTPTNATTCLADGLSAGLTSQGVAAGTKGYEYTVTNHSSSACSLTGYFGVSALDATGNQLPIKVLDVSGAPVSGVTLQPGNSAVVDLQAGNNAPCQQAETLKLTPPGQSQSVTTAAQGFTVCGNDTLRVLPVKQLGAR